MTGTTPDSPFWSVDEGDLMKGLGTARGGLSTEEAERRRALVPAASGPQHESLRLLAAQLKSPIVILLIAAAVLSAFLRDTTDAVIILVIICISALLSWWQERGAANAVRQLLSMVQSRVTVIRDGKEVEIPSTAVVAGDIVRLRAGSSIPGDGRVVECTDLFVDEASLTGETYPVEKGEGVVPPETPLAARTNAVFAGTHVVSGTATVIVVRVGSASEFGAIAGRLKLRPPETDFERGIRRFGYLIMQVTFVLLLLVFAINVHFHRPVIESFLFSLALAVGLTPQMLPAIIAINLARGARRMTRAKVIVRRLASIENFGSMDVLCSDKTGTLTEGSVRLHSAVDLDGQPSEKVMRYAHLNAVFESGFVNPIDAAIRAECTFDVSACEKRDEIPYDFIRKRLSVLVAEGDRCLLITKGAVAPVLQVCTRVETASGEQISVEDGAARAQRLFEELSGKGYRTLGVAYRELRPCARITRGDEADLVFLGFLVVHDPSKADVGETVKRLAGRGVRLKMITGDNRLVAASVGRDVGLRTTAVLTGPEMRQMKDEALRSRVEAVDIFAEVEPNQKERIILALKKAGHVVGFLGDGINDASALHAADVGISVDGAVDVAKEAADIVLLVHSLEALEAGVVEGRTTFANTLKYVHMATSANFGNMFSMAGASLFLPFLPLLPKQILLTNLLTDFPAMTIAGDRVDAELLQEPRRWDVAFIRRFMIVFGLLSSVFDYVTFGVLLLVLGATTDQFRTGWFIESVASASLAVLLIRSRRPFVRSRGSVPLLLATLAVVALVVLLPYTPLAGPLGLVRLSVSTLVVLGTIVAAYLASIEFVKRSFYRWEKSRTETGGTSARTVSGMRVGEST
jgi:P-type Mg2+ transporter